MLFSFSNNEESNFSLEYDTTCCTATVTYNGEYHSSYTSCVEGIGPESTTLACSGAIAKAATFIDSQQ